MKLEGARVSRISLMKSRGLEVDLIEPELFEGGAIAIKKPQDSNWVDFGKECLHTSNSRLFDVIDYKNYTPLRLKDCHPYGSIIGNGIPHQDAEGSGEPIHPRIIMQYAGTTQRKIQTIIMPVCSILNLVTQIGQKTPYLDVPPEGLSNEEKALYMREIDEDLHYYWPRLRREHRELVDSMVYWKKHYSTNDTVTLNQLGPLRVHHTSFVQGMPINTIDPSINIEEYQLQRGALF